MDAHYDSQIRLQSHHQTTFGGPARQFGSGGMGAFAMRMGRVAVPLVKKYVLPVAKEFGKNLVSAFVPELSNVVSGRKRPRKALKDTLKKSAMKTMMTDGGTATTKVTLREAAPNGPSRHSGSPATKKGKDKIISTASRPLATISKKKSAKRSRSEILSNVNFA